MVKEERLLKRSKVDIAEWSRGFFRKEQMESFPKYKLDGVISRLKMPPWLSLLGIKTKFHVFQQNWAPHSTSISLMPGFCCLAFLTREWSRNIPVEQTACTTEHSSPGLHQLSDGNTGHRTQSLKEMEPELLPASRSQQTWILFTLQSFHCCVTSAKSLLSSHL